MGTSQIPDKLTLTISGPNITAEKFVDGVRAFLELVNEVTRSIAGQARAVQWFVNVKPGSVAVEYVPRAVKAKPETVREIVDTVERGVVAVEAGGSKPRNFSDKAVEKVGKLAAIANGKAPKLDKVTVSRGHQVHPVTQKALAHVDSLSGIVYRDWGTIEGIFEMVSGIGGFIFKVKDEITNRHTICYFSDELVGEVRSAFRERVAVSGMIRYRGDGEPAFIDVEEMTVFPSTEESLPSAADVRGILRGVA